MNAFKRRLVSLGRLLVGRGMVWAGMGLGSTLLQALLENSVVITLILFLFTLGLVDRAQVPGWLPTRLTYAGSVTVLGCLLLLGVLRALFQMLAGQSFHALLELVRARLQMVLGYRMLVAERELSFSMSETHLLMGEYFTKASGYVYHVAQLSAGLLILLTFFASMLWLAWKEALLGVGCLSLFGLGIWRLNRVIIRESVHIPRQQAVLERAIVRVCKNGLLIRAMSLQRGEYVHFLETVRSYFHCSRRTFFLRDLVGVLPPMLGISSVVLIVWADLAIFHTPPVELVAFIYLFVSFCRYLANVTDQVGQLSHYWSQFDEASNEVLALSPTELAERSSSTKSWDSPNAVSESRVRKAASRERIMTAPGRRPQRLTYATYVTLGQVPRGRCFPPSTCAFPPALVSVSSAKTAPAKAPCWDSSWVC